MFGGSRIDYTCLGGVVEWKSLGTPVLGEILSRKPIKYLFGKNPHRLYSILGLWWVCYYYDDVINGVLGTTRSLLELLLLFSPQHTNYRNRLFGKIIILI